MRNVTLHAFNWRYSDILESLDSIRDAGYRAILIPPPLYSDPNEAQWWQRYRPKDYRVLLSYLGGKPELEQLIAACHDGTSSLKIYADLVLTRMAHEERCDRFDFPGTVKLEHYQNQAAWYKDNQLYGDLSTKLFSWFNIDPPKNARSHSGTDPDQTLTLKDSNWVLQQQRTMVKSLIDMGFDGFRLDNAQQLTERMVANLADIPTVWFGDGPVSDSAAWMMAYDDTLLQTMRTAFGFGGSLQTLVHPLSEDHEPAVTFVVNHKIPHGADHRPWLFERQDEHLAHAYLLGREGGMPLIYSDHNESTYKEDCDRWLNLYKRPDITAMIAFHNAVQGQPMEILFATDVLLIFRRGAKGIVALNKSGSNQWADFSTSGLDNPGEYKDLIHQYEMSLSGETFSLFVPPRTAQMWLAK